MNEYWKREDSKFHTDLHYVDLENRFIRHAFRHVKQTYPSTICKGLLDIGCGDPNRTRCNLSRAGYSPDTMFGDLNPIDPDVYDMDILDLPEDEYDVILACRILCNVPKNKRQDALASMYRALTRNGSLIFIDGFSRERGRIERARDGRLGWDRLPGSPSGSSTIDDNVRDLLEGGLFKPELVENIGADYIIHTRVAQKKLLPFGHEQALAYPRYSEAARRRFGYYIGGVYSKCR